MKFKFFIVILFVSFSYSLLLGQNQISVPFSDGFVGVNGGSSVSDNSYKLSSIGWANIQFSQNSSSTVFVAQGNDIIGNVIITDNNSIEYTIPGFIKWRTPNGGSPSTMVFSPSASFTLSTNGVNGSSTYAISSSSYIGLTFNGQTLSFVNNTTISGNAATSGLLTELNNYLATFSSITINDVVLNEGATATITITLSIASASTITVNYTTVSGTATSPSDYNTASGVLTFAAGQTSKTITVPIISDNIEEGSELFYISLTDPINASIKDASGSITINPSSGPLPVELYSFNVSCATNGLDINWSTASEHNSLEYIVEKSRDGYIWNTLETIPAAGNSTQMLHYSVFDSEQNLFDQVYFRLNQIDVDGENEIFGPITVNCEVNGFFAELFPNPAESETILSISSERDAIATISIQNQIGQSIFSQNSLIKSGSNAVVIPSTAFTSGIYTVHLCVDGKLILLKLAVF